MVRSAPTDLVVVAADPVIQGVIRLAASEAPAVGRVTVVPAPDMVGAVPAATPSIVVIDIDPSGSGIALIRTAHAVSVHARVVALSDRDDGPIVFEAIRQGVDAFLRKPEGLRDLSDVLRRVAAGERVVPPELDAAAARELRRLARQASAAADVEVPVTSREREILVLASDGFTTQQIGRRLGISPRTVETHIAKLYRKLGVRTRIQAVTRAAALGLIDVDNDPA